jgi:copper chaperone CopZ
MSTTDFGVTGLTCNHCVMTVSRAAALVPGVTGVSIDLVENGQSTLHVESDSTIDVVALEQAIDAAGYELVH